MLEKLLTEMGYDEVETLINNFIERSSQQSGEMPASTFFELLFERVSQRVKRTVEVEGHIVDGQPASALVRLDCPSTFAKMRPPGAPGWQSYRVTPWPLSRLAAIVALPGSCHSVMSGNLMKTSSTTCPA